MALVGEDPAAGCLARTNVMGYHFRQGLKRKNLPTHGSRQVVYAGKVSL